MSRPCALPHSVLQESAQDCGWRNVVLRKTLVFSSCLGLLFIFRFSSPAAVAQPVQQETVKPVNHCLESTCRDVPIRENLAAIDLSDEEPGTTHTRAIVGGFEQGAGIAGGMQFTTADAIPHL